MKKYQQLFKQIQETIQNETYAVGDFLPSEHDLMEQYQVSRDTVRKALSLLQEEGLIKKIRGQGSQVVKEETVNFPVSNLTSYQELVKELGLRSKTNVVSLDKIIIDKKSSLITGFPEFRMVWKVVRQRVVDDLVSVLDTDYLDMELIPNLTRQIAEQSIYSYIENGLKLLIDYAQKEISKSLISTNFSDISFLLVSQMGKSHFFTDLIMEICNHSWFFYFRSILMKKPSFSPMCL